MSGQQQQERNNNSNNNPVVASLVPPSPHPYSSVAISPSRHHAIVAGKDTLRVFSVSPDGLDEIRSIRISQHFQTTVGSSSDGTTTSRRSAADSHQTGRTTYGDVRDTFGLLGRQQQQRQQQQPHSRNITTSGGHGTTAIVTDVAWSLPQIINKKVADIIDVFHDNEPPPPPPSEKKKKQHPPTSVVAAAGSNGVVVIWNAAVLNSTRDQQRSSPILPEAVLSQAHSRAVNRLAWHPTGKRPELLLTASQDATVKLWERRTATAAGSDDDMGGSVTGGENPGLRSWFGIHSAFHDATRTDRSVTWHCRATFQPKSEAVRDIKWSPFHDDVFAMVTDSGYLIVYNMNVPARPWVKIGAHSGEATTVDWHPTRPYVIATGGGADRSVKIWDLEAGMNLSKKDDKNITRNASSTRSSDHSQAESETSQDDITIRVGGTTRSSMNTQDSNEGTPYTMMTSTSIGQYSSASRSPLHSLNSTRANKSTTSATRLHLLSISEPVTRLKWRPPAMTATYSGSTLDEHPPSLLSQDHTSTVDRHDAMLAVATAPKGGAAGGYGVVSLWSHHRPFMPLSVVEGHREGAVVDFVWLDTPPSSNMTPGPSPSPFEKSPDSHSPNTDFRRSRKERLPSAGEHDFVHGGDISSAFHKYHGDRNEDITKMSTLGVWQHVLSVGRDGRCLLQSFARGERPISRVPPSCFAMADLSPFQSGYGSLQVFSVQQKVPSSRKDDFALTGLRRDSITAAAPGVFRELPDDEEEEDAVKHKLDETPWIEGVRHPATAPELVFNVLDQGKIDDLAVPGEEPTATVMLAPEVVHLSRFADSYMFYPDEMCPTRVALCLHNANVAEGLRCGQLARMWTMLASILDGSGLDDLPRQGALPSNAMAFVLLPTLRSLLEERANAGDVQTCVAICEVMQVIERTSSPQTATRAKPSGVDSKTSQNTRIPGLELNIVREWYLSYIDLLQQMCLFSQASNLIRCCNDPFIGALNQKSTTIHESCPYCRKPLQGGMNSTASDRSETERGVLNVRRACRSCRRRVGLCFLCHEPVKGVFVWCPGCGHGGHLDHALQWFGGMSGKPVREMCPTGCGHKCNLVQQLSAFPRTGSLMSMRSFPSSSQEPPTSL